jgi:lysophospholipase L1-like esterase
MGTGGSSATGGSTSAGGKTGNGGSDGLGGHSGTGGVHTTGGATVAGGSTGAGGVTALGGAGSGGKTGNGGATGMSGGTTAGGATGNGGATAAGGSTGSDGGIMDSGTDLGIDTGSTTFDPCPATGACKILPLGDSITYGINYGGGYRIKLAIHAATDQKNITYVGYDTGNPPDSTALDKLGTAKADYVNKHEGHSGWTIQQDDDIVTGKSTTTNDGTNYTGKKVVADSSPNIILLHIGTNDIYGSDPGGAPTRLGKLIDDIVVDAPNALLVVSTIIPCTSSMCPSATVNTYNKAVPTVVQQRASAGKHVLFVDMFAAFPASDLSSDLVHPGEAGYEEMAGTWYTAIKSYLH